MNVNPDKFQAICIGKRTFDAIKSFRIGETKICEDKVSLFGVTIDVQLNFKDDISQICTKASQQLAVLKRIGKFFRSCSVHLFYVLIFILPYDSFLSYMYVCSYSR